MKKLNFTIIICFLVGSTLMYSQNPPTVYVSDAGGFNTAPWFVNKYDQNGTLERVLMTEDDNIRWPQDIVFNDDEGVVLISNLSAAGIISKHDPFTGDFIGNFAEGIAGPTRMKIGPDGLLYVLQWDVNINNILRYEMDGTFVDEFTSVGLPQSIGLDFDAAGNLYVSSYSGSYIQKFDTNGNDLGPFIDSGLSGPTTIWFDTDGTLIVLNYNNGIVMRFDADGVFLENLITGVGGCEGIDSFPNGDILIGVGSDGSVRRYDSDFNFIENFVEPNSSLITPNAILIRPDDYPLGITDFVLNEVLVTPSIGTEFRITDNARLRYGSLEIYDTTGKLIATLNGDEDNVWQASSLTEGLYFVVGIDQGEKTTQKIVVHKK